MSARPKSNPGSISIKTRPVGRGGVSVKFPKPRIGPPDQVVRLQLVPCWYLETILSLKIDPIKMHGERSPPGTKMCLKGTWFWQNLINDISSSSGKSCEKNCKFSMYSDYPFLRYARNTETSARPITLKIAHFTRKIAVRGAPSPRTH